MSLTPINRIISGNNDKFGPHENIPNDNFNGQGQIQQPKEKAEEPSKTEFPFIPEQESTEKNAQLNSKEEEEMEISENLKVFIKNKNLVLSTSPKIEISYSDIYKEKERQKLKESYDINCLNMENYFIISYGEKYYLFYKKLIKAKISLKYEDSTKDSFDEFNFCSDYDFTQKCQEKNYIPYMKINDKSYYYQDIFSYFEPKFLGEEETINLIQEYYNYKKYENDVPPIKELKENMSIDPLKLTSYFKQYFCFEPKTFCYWSSMERAQLILKINKFYTNSDSYFLKLCGPSGIGKSMTLFLISRTYKNVVYLNLKVLKNLTKPNEAAKRFNIILEAFKFLKLTGEQIEKLSKIFNELNGFLFNQILEKIVDFLKSNSIKCILILDQFKGDSIYKQQYKLLKMKIKNEITPIVKIIICSSTNDKSIRKKCIKSWKNGINLINKNIDFFSKGYYYISKLVTFKKNNNNYTFFEKFVNENFNFLPKYRNIFNYLKDTYDSNLIAKNLCEIKVRIKNNLFKLYKEIIDKENPEEGEIKEYMKKSLQHLSLYINQHLKYDKLEEIVQICSLKYYTFIFGLDYFSFNYSLEYAKEIIEDIIDEELELYFKDGHYANYTGSANSDFFEKLAAKSLTKQILKLPLSDKSILLSVKEIVEMKEFYLNRLNQSSQNLITNGVKEYEVKKDELKEGLTKTLILDENKEINIYEEQIKECQNNNIINKDLTEKTKENKENTKIELGGNLNKGKKEQSLSQENIENKEVSEGNEIEDEFTIRKVLNNFKKLIYFNYENIDSYKFKYIQSINKPYKINGNLKLADYNIFLNQKKQTGKKLDFCYLYGDKNNKTFIGFQMKDYDEESSHGIDFNETKESLKDSLKPILVNIQYLMGMTIKSWHYILIISYNKTKPEGKKYYKSLVEKCNTSGLEYLFFDPFECVFYNRNIEPIEEYIPNDISNLDNNLQDYLPINMMEGVSINDYQIEFLKNNKKDVNIIQNGFNSLLNKKRFRFANKEEINQIKNKLNKIINDFSSIILKHSIKFIGAYNYLNLPNIPCPQKDFLFLYPLLEKSQLSEEEEKINKDKT